MDFYWTDFENFGVVGKLRVSAFQRHKFQLSWSNINTFRDHVLIFVYFCGKNDAFLQFFDAFLSIWKIPKMSENQNMATKRVDIAP